MRKMNKKARSNHLCNTHQWMRKLQTKIRHRSMKEMINTGKLRVYSSFPSVYHLLNSGEWLESCEPKKYVKNRVKFKQTCRGVQVLHTVHFRRICFAIKAERTISPFSKLLENGKESQKTINMKKFRIFRSFSAVYYLPHSDKVCRNYGKNTFLSIFKTDIKR